VELYEGKARNPLRAAERQRFGLGYDVVDSLTTAYQLKNHIIYIDRFFSSVTLAEHLLQQNTYMNSTVMLNRKGLPAEARTLKLKKGQPCRQFLKGNMLLTGFFDKKMVCHLSTNCLPGLADDSERPIVNRDYIQRMGGVDRSDQHKWWKYILWYLVNLCVINAYLVWRATPTPPNLVDAELHARRRLTHELFHMKIVEQLVGDHAAMRRHRRQGVPLPIRTAALMDPMVALTHFCQPHANLRVCNYCLRNDNKTDTGKSVRSKMWCRECDVHLCPSICFQKHHAELCGIAF
jgi:hypothetical protein